MSRLKRYQYPGRERQLDAAFVLPGHKRRRRTADRFGVHQDAAGLLEIPAIRILLPRTIHSARAPRLTLRPKPKLGDGRLTRCICGSLDRFAGPGRNARAWCVGIMWSRYRGNRAHAEETGIGPVPCSSCFGSRRQAYDPCLSSGRSERYLRLRRHPDRRSR